MRQQVNAQVLTVYLGDEDQWRGGPLYAAIVARFREAGVAGVSVLRGFEGYGAHRAVHTQRIEVLSSDLPVLIEVVDVPERIAVAAAIVDEMVVEGLVTIHDVSAVRYIKDPKA